MKRQTGTYQTTIAGGEHVQAFLPHPLPPADPPLVLDDQLVDLLSNALAALGRLGVAGAMVPSPDWFLYGFVRKEAVVSSQIEGTQATLKDIVAFEATNVAERPDDVEEVCNYVDALTWARSQLSKPRGLPLSTRLLCMAHKRLMRGVRGAGRQPGAIRRAQNWIGGARPSKARFVPPQPDAIPEAMSAFENWLHSDDPLPPLVRAGLAHVQFETIHPFLDGNGRIGRLLITLLLEHWGVLESPLLYLSLALKRHQQEYYDRLHFVRTEGDWEGWTAFYLACVREAAEDGVAVAQSLFRLISEDRKRLLTRDGVTIPALRLFDQLPTHPMMTLPKAVQLLKTSKPTASKAITALADARVLRETTGKARDRVYAYHGYLRELTRDLD